MSCAKRIKRSRCCLGADSCGPLRFLKWDPDPQREATIIWVFAWDKIRMSAEVDAITKAGLQHRCGPLQITLDIFVVFHSV